MRRSILSLIAAGLLATPSVRPQAPEAPWYAANDERSVRSFLAHADRISVVAPQSFSMASIGIIWGHLDPPMVATARAKKVKLIPLIVNPGFDQSIFHHVLTNPDARKRAVHNNTALCRHNYFDGIQYHFENVRVTDR